MPSENSMQSPQLRLSTWGSVQLTGDMLPSIMLGFVVESLLYGRPLYFKFKHHSLPTEFEAGIHVILFLICAYILVRRQPEWKQQKILAVAVVMFILATADIGVSWNILLRHTTSLYMGNTSTLLQRMYPKFLIYIVNNLIADVLLVLRCYVVWDYNKFILIPSSITLVIGTVFGFISEGTVSVPLKKYIPVYIIMVVIFNLILTLLTAGRIYRIAREVKSIMGPHEMNSQYQFAVALIVESGLIYTMTNILVLSLSQTRFITIAAVLAIRTVCIMPILIIVQITLGQSKNLKDARMMATAHQAGTQTPVFINTTVSSVSSDRHDAEGQRSIRRPSVECAEDELQVPLADESINKDIILEQRERKTGFVP